MNRRPFTIRGALALGALASLPLAAPTAAAASGAPLKVVTSTTDLYDTARAVGGNRVNAVHISEGYQDPHFVEAKPSFILQLKNADVFAFVGLDLEIGWMPLLVDDARNSRIRMGGSGYLDVSRAIPLLDVPNGNVDRSQGDVQPLGNPHYRLDPDNAKRIARFFRTKFAELDPKNAAACAANEQAFDNRLDVAARGWAPLVAQIKGKPAIAYHTSWRYFAGFMEPKPGVPPSPSHLAEVMQIIRRSGAKVIIMEPFYDRKTADLVAARTGAKVPILPRSVGGVKGLNDYVSVMSYDIRQLASALT